MRILSKFLSDTSVLGERKRLVFVLLIGLMNGLLFTFIVPPWQHHDEPQHFEYVWLIYDQHRLPQPGDYDQEMRRATASSMLDHGFYEELGVLPDLNAVDKPIWIGSYSQLSNQPLYYLLASVPAIILDIEDVTLQLYSARLVSLILLLVTITAGWGVAAEFTPRGHPIRLYLPLTLAMLPGFTDVMTAVNNDAAAVAFVSLTLWGCIHLIRNGFSITVFLGTIIAVVASYFCKEVAIVSLLLFVVALLFVIFRDRYRWIPWAVIFVGGAAAALSIFVIDDAAFWYRSTAQGEPVRVEHAQAPLGKYVFRLDAAQEVTPRWMVPIFQPIPMQTIKGLKNAKFSLGAWIWADTPAKIRTPMIGDGYRYYYEQIGVTTEPTYYAFSVDIKDLPSKRLWVSLDPREGYKGRDLGVYYDGLVLTTDVNKPKGSPDFDDVSGATGAWNGEAFANLLRNGSTESAGIRLRSTFDSLATKFLPARASLIVTSALDPSGAGWIFQASGLRLFRTFWGKFGWGHVPLAGGKPYRILAVIATLGLIGFVYWLYRLLSRKKLGSYASFLPVLMTLFFIVWFGVITRGTPHLGVKQLYLPVARYAAAAIIPTVLILCLGWLEILRMIIRWLRIAQDQQEAVRFVVYLAAFVIFDLYALYSIIYFYSRAGT